MQPAISKATTPGTIGEREQAHLMYTITLLAGKHRTIAQRVVDE